MRITTPFGVSLCCAWFCFDSKIMTGIVCAVKPCDEITPCVQLCLFYCFALCRALKNLFIWIYTGVCTCVYCDCVVFLFFHFSFSFSVGLSVPSVIIVYHNICYLSIDFLYKICITVLCKLSRGGRKKVCETRGFVHFCAMCIKGRRGFVQFAQRTNVRILFVVKNTCKVVLSCYHILQAYLLHFYIKCNV